MHRTATLAIASAAAAAACIYVLRRRRQLQLLAATSLSPPLKVCETSMPLSVTPGPSAKSVAEDVDTAAAARTHAVGPVSPVTAPDFSSASSANGQSHEQSDVDGVSTELLPHEASDNDQQQPLAASSAAEAIEQYHASRREFNAGNKAVTRAWERREWNKAKAKLDAAEARKPLPARRGMALPCLIHAKARHRHRRRRRRHRRYFSRASTPTTLHACHFCAPCPRRSFTPQARKRSRRPASRRFSSAARASWQR